MARITLEQVARVALVVLAMPVDAACMTQSEQDKMLVDGKAVEDVFPDASLAELADAACRGETIAVAQSVKAGADPNGTGFQGTTPLFWALKCENVFGVEALLETGANPNYKFPGESGFTPVFAASGMRNPNFLRILIEYGGNPNTGLYDSDWTALKSALYLGMDGNGWENYNILLDSGVDINAYNRGTIAEIAADLYQYEILNDLLRRGYSYKLDNIATILSENKVNNLSADQNNVRNETVNLLKEKGIALPVTP